MRSCLSYPNDGNYQFAVTLDHEYKADSFYSSILVIEKCKC
jgi:hypothetical protein